MTYSNEHKSISKSTFTKFKKLYLLAFSFIVLSVVASQIFIQSHLNSQLNDSKIINKAGRQRMLSQKLVKEVLLLKIEKYNLNSIKVIIQNDVSIFATVNNDLQNKTSNLGKLTSNNEFIKDLFEEANFHLNEIVKSCNNLLSKQDSIEINKSLDKELSILLKAEPLFVKKMDEIVGELEKQSRKSIEFLKLKEYTLFLIMLTILFATIIFIFKPLSHNIRKIIDDLAISDKDSFDKYLQIQELYKSKEESLQELKRLHFAINNAALFASVSEDGTLLNLSKKFSKLLGISKSDYNKFFDSLFVLNQSQKQIIDDLLKGNRQSIWVEVVKVITKSNKELWLELTIIPTRKTLDDRSIFILCNDITVRIETQQEIDQLNEDKYTKQVAQQKLHASQIVEAQEEERKRIAKDIHDGIGQMLTALNFNIESINLENVESTSKKIDRLKLLLSSLIKEVRTVTFNLTPPELLDYGISATLSKLAEKLSDFTGKNIYFDNKTEFNQRFDSIVETNLYRVVQEAVNNSLKYAESNFILITMSHTKDMLSIVIDDDGKGFNSDSPTDKKGGGMGMFFMKERVSYINGRLFVNSLEEKGTRVTINLKLT